MEGTARLGAFQTSMLQDVEAGRPIELEALLGAPREIARARGIETPTLDRFYGVTKLMADTLGLGRPHDTSDAVAEADSYCAFALAPGLQCHLATVPHE